MKLIKTAPKQTKTFKTGDEIVVESSYFDGRVTEFVKTLMTVTKVNRVTLIADDKKGNTYQLDTRYDNITLRAEYNELWYNIIMQTFKLQREYIGYFLFHLGKLERGEEISYDWFSSLKADLRRLLDGDNLQFTGDTIQVDEEDLQHILWFFDRFDYSDDIEDGDRVVFDIHTMSADAFKAMHVYLKSLNELWYNYIMNAGIHYYEMYDKVQRGEISQEVWADYCMQLLSEMMEQPEIKAVFVRLKNRG